MQVVAAVVSSTVVPGTTVQLVTGVPVGLQDPLPAVLAHVPSVCVALHELASLYLDSVALAHVPAPVAAVQPAAVYVQPP